MQHKKNSKRGRPTKHCKRLEIKRVIIETKDTPKLMNKRIVFTGFAIVLISVAVMFMVSCTYSINMAHTDGAGTDVIDETDENQVSPDVQLPLTDLTYLA